MRRLLVGAAALAACSGGSGVAIHDLAGELDAAECAYLVRCHQVANTATCTAAYDASTSALVTLVADVDAKRVSYDADLGAACASSIENHSCDFAGFQPEADDPCTQMFTGTLAAGAACFETAECTGGNSCKPTDDGCNPSLACCPGACTAPPHSGDPCQSSADCAVGMYCTTANQCEPVATSGGASCQALDGCTNPMACGYDIPTNAFTTCYTPSAHGATCDPMAFVPCIDTRDYCDEVQKLCIVMPTIGEACQVGITCAPEGSCVNFSCTAKPSVGQSCSAASGCVLGLPCAQTCGSPSPGPPCN